MGGGSGAPGQTAISFTYAVSFGVSICEGPVDAVLKVWRDADLIYDATNTGPTEATKAGTFRIYLGTEDQEPDPAEQADKGIDDTPAYRGVCRIVFEDHDVTDIRRIPNIRALVARGTVTESLPLISVTGESSGTSGIRFAPDGRQVMFGTRGVTVSLWDTASQTQILTSSLSGANNSVFFAGGCFDSLGNWYATKTEDVSTGSVLKYAAETLNRIGKSQEIDLGGGLVQGAMAQVEALDVVGLPGFEIVIAVGFNGKVYALETGTFGTTDVSGDPLMALIRTIDPADFIGGNTTSGAITVDSEGFAWVLIVSDNPDILLLRLEPSLGAVVENYVIAGVDAGEEQMMAYEETTNSLIIGLGGSISDNIFRWGIDSQTIEAGPIFESIGLQDNAVFQQGPAEGVMWFGNGATLREIDVIDMVQLRSLNASDWPGVTSAADIVYDPLSNALVNHDTTVLYRWMFLERAGGGATTLDAVVDAVSAKVGLAPADIDTAALAEPVEGVVADRRMPARSFLEPLAAAHFFRTVESDWQVIFAKRGQAPVFAIAEEDLGAGPAPARERLAKLLAQELSLPERIDITYAEAGSDYQTMTQPAKRVPEAVGTRRRSQLAYPGVLTNDSAKQIVEKALYSTWTQRQGFEMAVPMTHLLLDPGDVGTVTEGGVARTVELAAVDLHAGGVVALSAFEDDRETFASIAEGAAGGARPGKLVVTGPSFWQLLDIPLLRDQDEGLIHYAAAGGYGNLAWPGLTILESSDGVNFAGVFTAVPGDGNIAHGAAAAALPPPAKGPYFLDADSTLVVRMRRGTLSSISFEALLEENSNVAIFASGEIVQYQNAVLQGDGSYLLSNLVRGLRGTENRMAEHAAKEFVIFPTEQALFRKAYGTERLNVARLYRGVTFGDPLSRGTTKSVTTQGRSKATYRPESLAGSITANDWTVTFKRRPRLGNVSLAFSDMPVIENVLDFGLRIYDGAILVRTITPAASANGSVITVSASTATGTQTALYDELDQIADFGAAQTSLTVEAFQVGELGEGEPSERITLQG